MNKHHEQIVTFMLMDLVEHNLLTSEEADLAKKIYFANDKPIIMKEQKETDTAA